MVHTRDVQMLLLFHRFLSSMQKMYFRFLSEFPLRKQSYLKCLLPTLADFLLFMGMRKRKHGAGEWERGGVAGDLLGPMPFILD